MPEPKSQFLKSLGDYPITRVLNFLIIGKDSDFSLSDISQGAGVSWSTIHEVIPELEKNKLIKQSRSVGRAKLYKINSENRIAQLLIEMHERIGWAEIEKEERRKELG